MRDGAQVGERGTTTISTPFYNAGVVTCSKARSTSAMGDGGGDVQRGGRTTISFSGGSFSYSTAPTLNGPGPSSLAGQFDPARRLASEFAVGGRDPEFGDQLSGRHDHQPDLIGEHPWRKLHGERTLSCGGGVAGSLLVLEGATLKWSGGTISGGLTEAGGVVNWSGGRRRVL